MKTYPALLTFLMLATMALAQSPPSGVIPASYFGTDISAGTGSPWPLITFGALGKGAGTKWVYIEQVKNTFVWTTQDAYVSNANAHSVPVLVTPILDGAPPWAVGGGTDCTNPGNYTLSQCQCTAAPNGGQQCFGPVTDTTGMATFLNTLVTRYNGSNGHGKVQAYEVQNEPESSSTPLANLVLQMNAVHDAVRANDPTAEVWGPGMTFPDTYYTSGNLFDQYVAAGLTKDLNALDFHGYPHGCCGGAAQAPEIGMSGSCIAGTGGFVSCVQAAITRDGYASTTRVNQSEGSWGLNTSYPIGTGTNDRPGWLARFYLLGWSSGVSRSDWYSYDSPAWGTLETSNVLNTTGTAYNQVYLWMTGSTMNTPCSASGTVWTCGLINSSGVQTLAVWNTAGSGSYAPAAQYTTYKNLAGGTNSVSGGSVTIGLQPILLVSANRPLAPTGLTGVVR